MAIINMNMEQFDKITLGEKPVLVEFWAPWCVYCRRIAPALNKVAEQLAGDVIIGQVNIDEEPQLAHRENIEVIPTMILYQNGEVLGSVVAPESKAAIEAFIRENRRQ